MAPTHRGCALVSVTDHHHGQLLSGDHLHHGLLSLENATIRFVKDTDGRGEGLGGLDLMAVNRARALEAAARLGKRAADGTIQVCGMRMNLVDG